MESVRVMDANGTQYENGSAQLGNDLQVSERLGDELLEDLDSYLEDIDDRLTISRMVSDSVIMGMVNAVEQEAVEKIARKELEVAELKDMLHLYHVGADEKESFGAPLMHHESKCRSHCRMCYNFSDTFVEHDSMRESLGSLRSTAKEQFKKLKKEIESIKGCSSIKKISSGSELLGLGGILQEKVPERWIDVDRTLESLKATVDTVYKQAENMFQFPKASLCAWQQEQVFQAEIEVMVNKTCIRGLQEEFEERLLDQSAQFYGNESVNWLEKINEISSLRQELNTISKSLSLPEFGQLTSLGSLEIGEEWINDKGTNHFHRKVLSNHVSSSTLIWEGNGKHEEASSSIPENSDHAQLKRMSKEELITEMTKMKRNHESKVQEMTEENFCLKRELLRLTERGSSLPLKKDKDVEMLRKKIPHFILKLDDILVENEKLHAVSENAENHGSLKDKLESLLSENRQLRDSLTDKKKEVKCLLSQVAGAADNMSQHNLIEANLLCSIEDARIEAFICEDVYKCLLMGLMGQFQCITEESNLEYNIMQEVYEIILKEASCVVEPTRKFEIEDSDMEPIIMQGLCGIIFREALKDAEEELRNLNMNYVKEIEEKDRLVQETTAALVKEKEKSNLTSQELDNLKDQTSQLQIVILESTKESNVMKGNLAKALEQIEQYKAGTCKLNQKLELGMKQFREVDEQRRMLLAVIQEKQNALSLVEAKERERVKQMESIIIFVQGLLKAVDDFENRVTEDISSIILRLENLSSESCLLMHKANMLQRTGYLYKQRYKRRFSDLEKAEAEVDLLGDEVDALLSLLEKIYIALDHYSPILKHYPGIIDILKLVRRELSGESTKAV